MLEETTPEQATHELTPEPVTPEQGVSRRTVLRLGAAGATGAAVVAGHGMVGPFLSARNLLSAAGRFVVFFTARAPPVLYPGVSPPTPLILEPFKDALLIPEPLKPIPYEEFSRWAYPPGPGYGQQ